VPLKLLLIYDFCSNGAWPIKSVLSAQVNKSNVLVSAVAYWNHVKRSGFDNMNIRMHACIYRYIEAYVCMLHGLKLHYHDE